MLGGWSGFIAAYAAFLLSHVIPVRPPIRLWLVKRLGETGFGVAYSALSLVMLVWLLLSARVAPFVALWFPPVWMVHVTLLGMALACLLIAFSTFRPNPLSFAGWYNAGFDPTAPGIVGFVRHPLLAALALWAAGHLAAKGDLAHILMFGGFAIFALLGMAMIDRRRRREIGVESWAKLVATAQAHRWKQGVGAGTILRAAGGAMLLLSLIFLHPWIAGIPIAGRLLP